MVLRGLRIANLVLAGVLTGNELCTFTVVHPLLQRLGYAEEVAGEQFVTRRLGAVMPPLMTATVATGAVAVAGLEGRERALVGAGTAAYAAMLAITAVGNMPVNVQTLSWDTATQPEAEWRRLRRRWDRSHALRVALDAAGLAALAAASR